MYNKLEELKFSLERFDVIVFSETRLNHTIDDALLQWEGFMLIRQDRDGVRQKRGGGICVYIKKHIQFNLMNNPNDSISNNIEYIHLKLKLHMQKQINLICVYRPPDGKHGECVRGLTRVLDQIDRSRSETVLIGDFNLDYNNKKLVASSKLETLVNKYALKQIIDENTRITDSSVTCIDLLFTDIPSIVLSGVIT